MMEKEFAMEKKENEITGMQKLGKGMLVILAIAFGVGGSILVGLLFGKPVKALFPNRFVQEFVLEALSAVLALVLIFLFQEKKVLKFSAEGMAEGTYCGMAWILFPLIAVGGVIFDLLNETGLQMISGGEITVLFLQCVMIGIFEEFVFRGVAQELAFELFGSENKKQARRAIVLVAFLFGAMHLINALQPEITIQAALMQAISVFGVGLVYGAIFYRSGRCIWPCVIFHALQDASAFVASGVLFGTTQEQAIGNTSLSQAIYSLLFVAWFIYLMRERHEEEA